MAQTILCPSCQRRLLLPEGLAGRPIRCPTCAVSFQAEEAPSLELPLAVPPPPSELVLLEVDDTCPEVSRAPTPERAEEPVIEDVLPVEPFRFDNKLVRPPRLPRARRRLGLAAVIVVACLAFGMYRAWVSETRPRYRPPAESESRAEWEQEVTRAFQGEAAAPEDETAQALREVFDDLGACLRAKDGNRIIGHFDVERTLEELSAQGLVPARMAANRDVAVRSMRMGLQNGLLRNAPMAQWKTFEIRSIRKRGPDELVVIARHRGDDGFAMKMRWWMKRRGSTWRIYDFEDLDMGMRASAVSGSVIGIGQGRALQLAADLPHLQEALSAVALRQDPDAAERELKQVLGTNYPAPFEALRHMIVALIQNLRGDYVKALASLDRAQEYRPDVPALDLLRGTICNNLRRWNQALTHLHAYRKLLGDDAVCCAQIGLALQNLERFAEARTFYRKALDDDPTYLDAYLNLISALGEGDSREDLAPRFTRLGNHLANFGPVVAVCTRDQDGESLEPVATAMQKLHPNHAPAYFQLAMAKVWRGRPAESLGPLGTAVAKDPKSRKKFVTDLARALAMTNKAPADQLEVALKATEDSGGAKLSGVERNLLRGILCARLQRWAPAVEHLQACRAEMNGEPALRFQLGRSLHFLRQFAEASTQYRQVLDDDPNYFEALRSLAKSLDAEDNRKELAERFAKLDQPAMHFEALAEACRDNQDWKGLELVSLEMQILDETVSAADMQLMIATAWLGRTADAAAHLDAAVAKEPGKRKALYREAAKVLAQTGNVVQVYSRLGKPREAFSFLAAELIPANRWADLRELTDAHTARHRDDAMLLLFRGELDIQDGGYAEADRQFAAGMARHPDADLVQPFRRSRVLAAFYTGRALAAYAEIGPAEETFGQLAALAYNQGDDALLEKLLALHGPKHPGSRALHCYRFRLKIRQGHAGEAVALFQAALKKVPPNDHQELIDDFLDDMAQAGHAVAAYRAAPDPSRTFAHLAAEVSHQHEQLAKLCDVHLERHRDDPALIYYRGLLLMDGNAWEGAIRVFGEGLKRECGDFRQPIRRQYVLAMHRAGKDLQAYRDVDGKSRNDVFVQLGQLLLSDRKGKELQELTDLHRPHAGAEPGELLFFEACACVLQKNPGRAVPLIRQAYEKQSEEDRRREYVRQFVHEMAASGQLLEGYRTAPDKPYAFDVLARRLLSEKKGKELAALLQAHSGVSDDPQLPLYRGELYLLEGKVKEAEETFAVGLAKTDPDQQFRLRSALFRTRLRLGKVADTYREFGSDFFETLALLCVNENNAAALTDLVAARRQERPSDAELPAWELEACWLKQDYQAALKLLSQHRQGVLARPRHRWKADDYLVRCLVRLKRLPEAIREATRINNGPHGRPVLLVLAHVAADQMEQACAVVEKEKRPWLVGSCYADKDLGPILRSDRFKPFREKFPEPKRDSE